ncbi:hypothetical protein [Rhodococcoides kroppenstedtii]|uniref:hypothetical protein n=1 Tax=Rhodococcoides kroppenstedtii TaxID=293050 RepID=UPI00362EF34D
MNYGNLRDRPVDFSSHGEWSLCPHCRYRRLVPHDELYGRAQDCPGCSLSVGPGKWQTGASDLILTSADVRWVCEVSWFHTSVHRVWPPAAAAAEDRAVHLGTYEAAIESMLYRMSAMAEHDQQFYLHRVEVPDISVDPAMHDDLGEALTGFVELNAVTSTGYQGLRYINEEEQKGSISLAVSPRAIRSVQSVAIPAPGLSAVVTARTTDCARRYDADRAAAESTLLPVDRENPLGRLDRLMGTTVSARRLRERDHRMWSAIGELFDGLSSIYVADVAPGLRERLEDAVRATLAVGPAAGSGIAEVYRRYAGLIVRSSEVLALVGAVPASRPTLFD